MPTPNRPNVLIIMSDEHYPAIMGCAGDPLVRTPALDALARRGTRMAGACCNFPLCGPSRMSFMTGRYASRIRCIDNLAQLSSDIPTFAHGFLAADYETVLSGRMHFVGQDQRHGFESRIISDVTTAYVNLDWKLKPVLGDLVDTPGYGREGIIKSGPGRTGYHAYDEAVTRATVDWLEARTARITGNGADERPFMMTVGYAAPHCPFVAPPEDFHYYYDRISEADLPMPHHATLHPALRRQRERARMDAPTTVPLAAERRARAAYYGLCTFLDRLIGQVFDALERTGLAENTIVVYTSDHGEQLGEHGLWWKTSFYQSSVGIPMLIAGPGLPAGNRVGQNVGLMDVGPTLLDLVGAAPLPDTDGRSFRCLLDGKFGQWDDQVIAENVSAFSEPPIQRMVRRGPWKLNYYHGMASQLFNLQDDPGELNDRIDDPACKEIIADLMARLMADWSPKQMDRLLEMRLKEGALIRKWLTRVEPAEPDALWFDGPLENWIDAVEG